MDLDINVYLTTKSGELPDLSSCKDEKGFHKWENEVKSVAFHHESFSEIRDELINEAQKYPIIEAFALIEYPPGKIIEASGEVGGKLKSFFMNKKIRFSWSQTRDEGLKDGYKVSLEIIVNK